MKPIKKYINQKGNGLVTKLASYGAMAAAFMATSPEVVGQCAAPGAPLDIDIDGDGVTDITFTVSSGALYDPPPVSISTVTGFNYNPVGSVYVLTTIGPVVSSLYTAGGAPGCVATLTAPWQIYVNIISTATAMLTYLYSNLNVSGTYQVAYANVPGGNQILGTTAGASNCPAATAYTAAFLNSAYNGSYSFMGSLFQYYRTDVTYSAYAASVDAANPNGCVIYPGGPLFAGYASFVYGPTFFVANTFSTSIPAFTSGPTPISGNTAGASQLAVQFDISGETHNGWVEVVQNADGSVCVGSTGYNGCSIETATANGTPDDACIASGTPSINTADGCPAPPVCNITTSVDVVCDDAGTPGDPTDDMTTVTITVNNDDPANFPTFTDNMGNAGVAYGTPIVYNVVGDGGLSVTFTDDTDGMCTAEVDVATGCPTEENIPTVGEWGLIILGLLMSITAIVGIRQRREEEVVA